MRCHDKGKNVTLKKIVLQNVLFLTYSFIYFYLHDSTDSLQVEPITSATETFELHLKIFGFSNITFINCKTKYHKQTLKHTQNRVIL